MRWILVWQLLLVFLRNVINKPSHKKYLSKYEFECVPALFYRKYCIFVILKNFYVQHSASTISLLRTNAARYLPFYSWFEWRREHLSFVSVNWIQSISFHFIFYCQFRWRRQKQQKKNTVFRIMEKSYAARDFAYGTRSISTSPKICCGFSTCVLHCAALLFDQRQFRNNKPINELTNVCTETLLQAFYRIYYSFALWTVFNSFIK